MLNIARQSYNTGVNNTAKLFPDEDQRIGVAFRNLKITLGAAIAQNATAIIYTPQDCRLLNYIQVGTALIIGNIYALPSIDNNGNLIVTAIGGVVPAGTNIEVIAIEKA